MGIVEVIGKHVRLRKQFLGKNWVGLCPFHEEQTPSFMVNPAKETWHCFGCGTGGDAASFLQRLREEKGGASDEV
jgi:DNA primase